MCANKLDWPYDVLKLDTPPTEKRAVKRAYAKQLKMIDQAIEPDKFQALREAYEYALFLVDCQIDDNLAACDTELGLADVPPHAPLPVQADDTDQQDQKVWNKVSELCKQLSTASIAEFPAEKFRRIFKDPVFQDMAAMRELENATYQHLTDNLLFDDDGYAYFSAQISDSLLRQIDESFGWFSDSVSFQNRFYVAPEFIMAMAALIDPPVEFKQPENIPRSWFASLKNVSNTHWFVLGWFGLFWIARFTLEGNAQIVLIAVLILILPIIIAGVLSIIFIFRSAFNWVKNITSR